MIEIPPIEHPIGKTLKDVMPNEFMGGEYDSTRTMKFADKLVTVIHHPPEGGKSWPGPHKNIVVWVELETGHAVGWNENVSRGWSFPIIKL